MGNATNQANSTLKIHSAGVHPGFATLKLETAISVGRRNESSINSPVRTQGSIRPIGAALRVKRAVSHVSIHRSTHKTSGWVELIYLGNGDRAGARPRKLQ
jgi:hypothetical protein